MSECKSDVLNASIQSVVLAVELGEDVLARGPEYVGRVLNDSRFTEVVQKALLVEAKRMLALQNKGTSVTNQDGVKVLKAAGKAAAGAGTQNVKQQIEGGQAYKKLQRSLDTLVCSYKKSPVGVWINENEMLLIIVASGLAVGGAAAMYQVRKGDQVAAWGLDLAKTHFDVEVIGGLKLGVSNPEFVPSRRRIGLKGFAKADFKGVKGTLDVSVATQENKLAAVSGNADIVVPISSGLAVSGKAAVKGARNLSTGTPAGAMAVDYDFGLGLSFSESQGQSRLKLQLRASGGKTGDRFNVGGSGGVNYNTAIGGLPTKVGVSGHVKSTRPVSGGEWGTEYGVALGIEFSL